MTIGFDDIIKKDKITNYDNLISLLKTNNIVFKESSIGDNLCKIVIVDNEEKQKHSTGVKYDKGKSKYYFIDSHNTIIHLKNYFGWNGRGDSSRTSNFIDIFKTDKPELYKQMEQYSSIGTKIKDIEDEIKKNLNIVKIIKESKYEDIIDFAKNNKLFSKYLFEVFKIDKIYKIDDLKLPLSILLKKINKNSIKNKEKRLNMQTLKNCLDICNIKYDYYYPQSVDFDLITFVLKK